MTLENKTIGFAMTGSFCMYEQVFHQIQRLVQMGANVIPIFSYSPQTVNCRFGTHQDFLAKIKEITGKSPITSIEAAEPIGPKSLLDIMLIAPCTGNTIAKLANAITDTPVLMAAKAHMRNEKPLVIAVSTNDALGINFKNIGYLYNQKHIYFVPLGQDDWKKKPASLVADMDLIPQTLENALDGQQVQPVIISR